jgi:hypothetical protein
MGNFLSKGLRKLGSNIKKHGGKILSTGLGIAGLMGGGPLLAGLFGGGGAGGGLASLFGGGGGSGFMSKLGGFFGGEGGGLLSKITGGIGKLAGGAMDMAGGPGGLLGMHLMNKGMQGRPTLTAGQLNQNLNPLQQSYDAMGDLSKQYMDPNSAMNENLRSQISRSNVGGMATLLRRQQGDATGNISEFGSRAIDQNTISDAIAKGLGAHSSSLADSYKQGAGLLGQQATLGNALSQAQTQNMMYANQQAQQPFDYMAQTGMGLLQRGLYSG